MSKLHLSTYNATCNDQSQRRRNYVSWKVARMTSALLSSERTSFCETCLSTSRLAEDGRTACADDNGLGVGEDGGDGEAAGALDIHEE